MACRTEYKKTFQKTFIDFFNMTKTCQKISFFRSRLLLIKKNAHEDSILSQSKPSVNPRDAKGSLK